jgi:hypothetical protein
MSYFHAVAVAVRIVATASADKARQSLACEDYLLQVFEVGREHSVEVLDVLISTSKPAAEEAL